MFFAVTELAYQIQVAKRRIAAEMAEDARLRALPPKQQAFELRLREVKALEAQASRPTTINVRSSVF